MGFGVSSWEAKLRDRFGRSDSFDFRCHHRYLEFLSRLASHIIHGPALLGARASPNPLADSPRRKEASGKRTFIELEREVREAWLFNSYTVTTTWCCRWP